MLDFSFQFVSSNEMGDPIIFEGDVTIEANPDDPTDFGSGNLIIEGTVFGGDTSGDDLVLRSNTSNDGNVEINNSENFLVDTTAFSIDASGGASNLSVATSGAGQDLTIGLTGATDSSIILTSAGTGADSIRLDATGGIDIDSGGTFNVATSSTSSAAIRFDASTGAAGMDIDLGSSGFDLDTSGPINLATSEGAGGSITLDAATNNGGITISSGSQGIAINSGTGLIGIGHWSAGDIDFGTSATARTITIGNTTGATDIQINSGSGGIVLNSNGGAVAVEGVDFQDDYFTMDEITAPSDPTTSEHRFYLDSSDSKLRSRDSSGTITVYQPTTTKGDLVAHNGTTQVRFPIASSDDQVIITDSGESVGFRWGILNQSSITVRETKLIDTYSSTSQDLNDGTFGGVTLDVIRTTSDAFFHSTSSSEIEVLEDGIYIVFARFTGNKIWGGDGLNDSKLQLDTGSGYSDIVGTLMQNSFFNNSSGTQSSFTTCILDLDAGDTIQMVSNTVISTDIDNYPNGTGIIMVKLQTGESINYNKHFDAYSTATTSITGTWADIPLNVERIKETPFVHSANSAELEVSEAGTYVVMSRATFETNANGSRSNVQIRLSLDTGSGYNQIDGTIGYTTHYDSDFNNMEHNAAGSLSVLTLSSGDTIKLQAQRNVSSDSISLVANTAGISAFRINLGDDEDDTEYFEAYNTSPTSIGGTFTDIPLNVERIKDSIYTHTTNAAQVTVTNTGLYFVFAKLTVSKSSGFDRGLYIMRLVEDTGSGFNEVGGSRGGILLDQNGGASGLGGTATAQLFQNFASGTSLKLQAIQSEGSNVSTVSGGSSIVLIRLKLDTVPVIPNPLVVFGSQAKEVESAGLSSTISTSYVQKLRLTTADIPAGTYRIGIYYGWSYTSTGRKFHGRVQVDDTSTVFEHDEEPKSSETDGQFTVAAFAWVALQSGVHNIDLDWRSDQTYDTAYIRDARLEFWRVL